MYLILKYFNLESSLLSMLKLSIKTFSKMSVFGTCEICLGLQIVLFMWAHYIGNFLI